MSKCPLCGGKLRKNLIDLRIPGTTLPELFCEDCDYDVVALVIESKELGSVQAKSAFEALEELNNKLLEKTSFYDTIKNLVNK